VKEAMLTADEKALFNVANGFAIRHNNRDQRGDYDRVTWLPWGVLRLPRNHRRSPPRPLGGRRAPAEGTGNLVEGGEQGGGRLVPLAV
jgi:hypothetical protein